MEPIARVGKVVRFDNPIPVDLSWISKYDPAYPCVIIRQKVLNYLYKHSASELQHEVGGYLLGLPCVDISTGDRATYIHEAIRARYESTPTHVKMLPTTFQEVEAARVKSNMLLVGYYHSHPSLSVFQSGEDVRNFQMYYPEQYQIAIVVDPSKTSRQTFYSDTSWIGYFAWDTNHKPVRLANRQIFNSEDKNKHPNQVQSNASETTISAPVPGFEEVPYPHQTPSSGNQTTLPYLIEESDVHSDVVKDQFPQHSKSREKRNRWVVFGLALLVSFLLGFLAAQIYFLLFFLKWRP